MHRVAQVRILQNVSKFQTLKYGLFPASEILIGNVPYGIGPLKDAHVLSTSNRGFYSSSKLEIGALSDLRKEGITPRVFSILKHRLPTVQTSFVQPYLSIAHMSTRPSTKDSSNAANAASGRKRLEHLSPEKLKQFYDMMLEYELTEKNARALLTGIDPTYFARADFELQLRPKLELFRSCGLKGPSLARSLHAFQKILWLDTDGLQRRADYLRSEFKLTTEDLSRILMLNPSVLAMTEQKLKQKVEYLCDELTITEAECMRMAVHFPPVFNYQIEGNMRPKMDFLMHELHLTRADLTRVLIGFPQIFGLHIRRGLQQKWEVLQYFVEDMCSTPPGTARKMVSSHIRFFSYSLRRRLLPRFAYISLLGPVLQIHAEVPASIGSSRPSALSLQSLNESAQFLEEKDITSEAESDQEKTRPVTAMQRLLEASPEQFDYSLKRRKQIELEERARRVRALAFTAAAQASIVRVQTGGSIQDEVNSLLNALRPSSRPSAKPILKRTLKQALSSDSTTEEAENVILNKEGDTEVTTKPKKKKTKPRFESSSPEATPFYKMVMVDYEPTPPSFTTESENKIAQDLQNTVQEERRNFRIRYDESLLESVQRRSDSEGLISPIIGSLSPLLSPTNASFMQRLPFALFRLVPSLRHTVPPPNQPIRPEHFKEFLSAWMRECRKIVNGAWGYPDGKFCNSIAPPNPHASGGSGASTIPSASSEANLPNYFDDHFTKPRQGRRRPKPSAPTTKNELSGKIVEEPQSDSKLQSSTDLDGEVATATRQSEEEEDDDSDTDLVRAEDLVTLFFDMRSQVELASAQEKDLRGMMMSPVGKQLATALKQMDEMMDDGKDNRMKAPSNLSKTSKASKLLMSQPTLMTANSSSASSQPASIRGQSTSLVAIAMLMLQHQRRAYERERQNQYAGEVETTTMSSLEEPVEEQTYAANSVLNRIFESTVQSQPSIIVSSPTIASGECLAIQRKSKIERGKTTEVVAAAAAAAAAVASQPRGRVRTVEVELQTNIYGNSGARHRVCVTGIPEGLNLNDLAMIDADENEVRMPQPGWLVGMSDMKQVLHDDISQRESNNGQKELDIGSAEVGNLNSESPSSPSDSAVGVDFGSLSSGHDASSVDSTAGTTTSLLTEEESSDTSSSSEGINDSTGAASPYDHIDAWLEQLGMAVSVTEASISSIANSGSDGKKYRGRGQSYVTRISDARRSEILKEERRQAQEQGQS